MSRRRPGAAGEGLSFSAGGAEEMQGHSFDLEAIHAQGYAYERLDQLTMEILLGVR